MTQNWKITSGGYIRFDKSSSKFHKPSLDDISLVNDFLSHFGINLSVVDKISVIDDFTHHTVIISNNKGLLIKKYIDNKNVEYIDNFISGVCKFNNDESHDGPFDLTIVHASSW